MNMSGTRRLLGARASASGVFPYAGKRRRTRKRGHGLPYAGRRRRTGRRRGRGLAKPLIGLASSVAPFLLDRLFPPKQQQ